MPPLSYTNRQGKMHYFRAIETAKGAIRYYITKSDQFTDLIETLPIAFEIYENVHDARVVIRKRKLCVIMAEEIVLIKTLVEKLSNLKDIIIEGDGDTIVVWHSQFNYIGGQEDNLTIEEAKEYFGESVESWMKYDDNFRFVLMDLEKRIFRAERRVFMGFRERTFTPLKEGIGSLKKLAEQFCPHMGRESYFHTVPEGFDE
jgi:hypothetical protein